MRPFSSYIRILDRGYRCDKMQDFLSLLVFRFRTDSEPNLTLIIHIAPAKEMLLGNLLSVHGNGCVSIYFIYPPPPFPLIPRHRLIYGFSPGYSSPSCSSHAIILVSRLFCPKRKRTRAGYSMHSMIAYLFLLRRLEVSRRDKSVLHVSFGLS